MLSVEAVYWFAMRPEDREQALANFREHTGIPLTGDGIVFPTPDLWPEHCARPA
jgi:hypothetical protein